jgi:hypothetical protein
MLRVTELRPGNWLIDNADGNLCTIVTTTPVLIVERFQDLRYECSIGQLQPIFLSTDLITACGFHLGDNNNYEREASPGRAVYLSFRDAVSLEVWIPNTEPVAVEYVHQLQNLYYNLTGQLLNINLYGSV